MNKYKDFENYLKQFPSKDGYFGEYGGSYQAKELIEAFREADDAYEAICHSAQFINELRRIRKEFQGRPTPVYHCERLSKIFGNCQIYLKREDIMNKICYGCGVKLQTKDKEKLGAQNKPKFEVKEENKMKRVHNWEETYNLIKDLDWFYYLYDIPTIMQ